MDILTETQNLLQRFQNGTAFRIYLRQRLVLVIPALLIFVAFSVATTAGTVIALGGTHSILVLFGMIAAPFVLLGTLYIQAFVFFCWLESRAIAQATHHGARTPRDELIATYKGLKSTVGPYSPIVQGVGAAVLLLPLWLLSMLSLWVALLLLVLVLATPAAYALLDR